VARSYREREPEGTLERFLDRVADYGAAVRVVSPGGVAGAAAEACGDRGLERLAVPADVPRDWLPDGVEAVPDTDLDVRELDRIGAALTACGCR
jgi:L-lactate dehydrogenase complex protein LldG